MRTFLNETDLYEYYCKIHKVTYKPQEKLICSVCGETKNVKKLNGIPYCKKHYNHIYRYGKIIEKTIYDKNDYILEDNITKIVLRDKYQNINGYCVIDTEDYDKVKMYKWYLSGGYCVTKGIDKNNGIDIYCVIFNNIHAYDHINNDKLDNKKSNLRIITSHQNAMNMSKKCTNTSGVVGVKPQNPNSPRWIAGITYNYKNIWLGSYYNFDDAVLARLKGEVKYFKEYSNNYKPELNLIALEYISKNDNKKHYVEINLDGKIITNDTKGE